MHAVNTTRRIALRNGSANRLLFHAPLRTTLEPRMGQGAPTFTRASTAYVEDHEGLLKLAKSGEARFKGARRVENLLAAPENLSSAAWTKQSGVSITNLGAGVWRVSVAAGVGIYAYGNTSSNPGAQQTIAVDLWLEANSGNNTIYWSDPSSVGYAAQNIILSITRRRYSIGPISLGIFSATGVWLRGVSGGPTSFLMAFPQIENVTGQSSQSPSEYVSRGMLSAPFHGAGVDGVRYFDYANGNTVASNIVTETQGAPFSTAPTFYRDSSSTNILKQSEDFTNVAWIASGLASVAGNSVASPNGMQTADSIVEDTSNAMHGIRQDFTKSASPITYSMSVYVKPNGRHALLSLEESTGASGVRAVFNLSAGAIGVTAAAFGSGFTAIGAYIFTATNGFYRCILVGTSDASTQLRSHVRINNSPNSIADVFVGDGVSGLYLWGAQLEAIPCPTSYIPTTTAPVTRNGDVLSWPLAGNLIASSGSAVCRLNPYPDFTRSQASTRLIGTSSCPMYLVTGARRIGLYDGLNVIETPTDSTDTANIAAASAWGGSASKVAVKGSSASGSFKGSWSSLTAVEIGGAAGGFGFTGTMADVKIWSKSMPLSKLQQLTS